MAENPNDPWLAVKLRGDSELALSFACFFWPRFVERRGCVLLAHRAEDAQIAQWLEHTRGNVQQVQAALNHVHLHDELPGDEPDDAALMEVGRVLQRCWTAALADQFPDRAFTVELVGPEEDYGPTLTLVARREPSSSRCRLGRDDQP
jgi:hypothetical protein